MSFEVVKKKQGWMGGQFGASFIEKREKERDEYSKDWKRISLFDLHGLAETAPAS